MESWRPIKRLEFIGCFRLYTARSVL